MRAELVRSEIQRLLRRAPFQPFILTFQGGERAFIEHPENIAFDPRPGSSSDFYVLTGSLRMFSTFEAVSRVTLLAEVESNGNPEPEGGAA